jgi:serine protease AprX
VGATDEHGTSNRGDDTIPSWSSYGVTLDGVAKPDVYAPGRHIISTLSSISPWWCQHSERVYGDGEYFRMSGTSMAAPMVAGVAAQMLYIHPEYSPDEIKYFMMHDPQAQISSNGQSGGYLHAYEYGDEQSDYGFENQDNMPHMLLRQTAFQVMKRAAVLAYYANEMCGVPVEQCDMSSVNWASVNWASVNWASVNWASVNWASVNWASVNWASVNWASVNWASVNWASVNWASVNWASVNWASNTWDTAVNWASVNWASVNWNSTMWDD